MIDGLAALNDRDLESLAAALRGGRLGPPFAAVAIERVISRNNAEPVASAFERLAALGFSAEQIAVSLEVLRHDRAGRHSTDAGLELVTTGPEAPGVANRDTSVVVRDLFAFAEHSVLLAGYAVYQGQQVFRALADRMRDRPELHVRMFLDVSRAPGDTTAAGDIVRRFAERFQKRQWPAERTLPELFYDPRALEIPSEKRACLHAKCVVVDQANVFISSANFTEAAHERNIEMGLLVRSASLARQVEAHFSALVEAGMLQQIPFSR